MSTEMVFRSTRRTFMKQLCAGAVALTGAELATRSASAASAEPADSAWGVLIDLTRCTGCQSCALACKSANQRPHADVQPVAFGPDAYSFVETRTIAKAGGGEESVHVKRQCMHCVHPACASACTVGALRKTAAGPVVYDAAKCIGCRYCQYACPHGVPAYDWENPLGLIHKCEMCVEKIAQGGSPACVAACPNGALRFGKRADLIIQAHAQIESNPGRYVNHVYGEHEAGGASMLYLSPVPFAALGFPVLGDQAISAHAESVMVNTPWIAVTVAAVATALQLILARRNAVAEFTPAPVQEEEPS